MKIIDTFTSPTLERFPSWENLKDNLSNSDYARACIISTDDWSENVIFQLVRHDRQKTGQRVYTYHVFRDLSVAQVKNELQELIEG